VGLDPGPGHRRRVQDRREAVLAIAAANHITSGAVPIAPRTTKKTTISPMFFSIGALPRIGPTESYRLEGPRPDGPRGAAASSDRYRRSGRHGRNDVRRGDRGCGGARRRCRVPPVVARGAGGDRRAWNARVRADRTL